MRRAACIRSFRRAGPARSSAGALVALLAGTWAATGVHAQATWNQAPRIGLAGISDAVRADTLCVTMAAGQSLHFVTLAVADADVGPGLLRVRVELEPGGIGVLPWVAIPALAGLPGVGIIREEPERIRFTAPLDSVNAALGALEYRSGAAARDLLDIIVDDQQLPPLSAEFRLHIEVRDEPVPTAIERCRPPPDLRPGSDSGHSDDDDITSASVLEFDVTGVLAGDHVVLMNDENPVSEAIADAGALVMVDAAPLVGATALYSVSVNGDAGSASWSIAVVSATVYADGFELR